ncbi:MAG: hypothetical protein FWD80_02640 [Propionibacteriaceae bacterium]|nr:hypothetical protein [Propionibacteriaceae bacterium]
MGKKTAIFGAWVGFLAIVYFAIYRGFVYKWFGTTGDEAFIAFCSLALFFGQNGPGKFDKKFWSFAGSGICGAIWGWIFVRGVNLLMPLFGTSDGPPTDKIFVPAALIDILVLTAAAIIVHTFLLQKTLLNNMAYVFLGVATTFSGTIVGGHGGTAVQGLLGVLQLAILLICGMLIGLGSNALAPKIFGPPPVEVDVTK